MEIRDPARGEVGDIDGPAAVVEFVGEFLDAVPAKPILSAATDPGDV